MTSANDNPVTNPKRRRQLEDHSDYPSSPSGSQLSGQVTNTIVTSDTTMSAPRHFGWVWKAWDFLFPLDELCQLCGHGRTIHTQRSMHCIGCWGMATSYEIQDGLDLYERQMGASSSITNWQDVTSMQMSVPIQVCIWIRELKVKGPTSRERFETRKGRQLWWDILSRSEDDDATSPTLSHCGRRSWAGVDGHEDDILT